MTAQNENKEDVENDTGLDSLLRMVESIDKNVEDILEAITEHFDRDSYEPVLNGREYFNDKDY